MKITLFGAAGYVGSALYRHLTEAGHEVAGVELLRRGNPAGVPCRDYYDLDVGCVIWVAGCSSVEAAVADPRQAIEDNLFWPIRLAQSIRPEVRFIYASSASVYNGRLGADETTAVNPPTTVYDASKLAADLVVPVYHPLSFGLRFGTVNGRSGNMRWELMLNRMVRDALTLGVVSSDDVGPWRPVLAMPDLCRAAEALVEGRGAPGIYNLASMLASAGQYAREVCGILGVKHERWEGGRAPYSMTMDCGKAVRELGWEPQVDCETLIEDLAEMVRGEKEAA